MYYNCVFLILNNREKIKQTELKIFFIISICLNVLQDDCKDPPVCQNGGFVKQINGVCSCECVDGLTGPDCTELDTSPGLCDL